MLAVQRAEPAEPLAPLLQPVTFLAGCWSGEGWLLTRGARQPVLLRECFETRLGGAALLAEPTYRARQADGTPGAIVRRAMAMFVPGNGGTGVRLRTIFPNGGAGEFAIRTAPGRLEWTIPDPAGDGRWIMERQADGTILEYGEFPEGNGWQRTFEMRLTPAG